MLFSWKIPNDKCTMQTSTTCNVASFLMYSTLNDWLHWNNVSWNRQISQIPHSQESNFTASVPKLQFCIVSLKNKLKFLQHLPGADGIMPCSLHTPPNIICTITYWNYYCLLLGTQNNISNPSQTATAKSCLTGTLSDNKSLWNLH